MLRYLLLLLFLMTCSAAANTNAAVLAFSPGGGIDSAEANIIAERFQAELLNTGKYKVLDRQQMDAILREQGFQQSGACTGGDCSVQIGQLLGVDKIFTGSVSKIGSLYTLNVRRIDVTTGQVEAQFAIDSDGGIEETLTKSCKNMAAKFTVPDESQTSASSAKKSGSSLWIWIGGGVLVAGGITAAILLNQPKTDPKDKTVFRDFTQDPFPSSGFTP